MKTSFVRYEKFLLNYLFLSNEMKELRLVLHGDIDNTSHFFLFKCSVD